ncbi:MAG: response regulator transcription factor [Oscillospiraceae bacterium]|nr:response regulator transcription factor [Oscillospiraceae bacterium]
MPKVFIVEDDENIRQIVIYALQSAGFEARGFECGAEYWAAEDRADILLLDIMLPGEDGFSILKRLRASPETKPLPVIMLTAKDGEYDKVKGLDMGADDYVAKPFGVMELISRVNALLRRSGTDRKSRLKADGLTLDTARREVRVNGEKIALTFKEYELLHYLLLNAGLVLSRDRLMEVVWGYDFEGESRTLDMHIRSLRVKLRTAGTHIQTVRNVGYKFEE